MGRLNQEINNILRGDNYSVELNIKDPNGVPIDLRGRTLYMTLKLSPEMSDSDVALLSKTQLVDAHSADAETGKAYIILSPEMTETLQPMTYWYDIQLVTDSSTVLTLLRGRVIVDADITRTRGL